MNAPNNSLDTYREELARLADLLRQEKPSEDSEAELAANVREQMSLFAEENLDKRFDKLENQLEFLQDAIPDMDKLISEYVQKTPQLAYDTVISDGSRFLDWVGEKLDLDDEQQDFVRCQRARHEIDQKARENRLAHVRFQELRSVSSSLANELGENPGLRIHLNPIRIWSRFETNVLLDEDADVPADILFYAYGAQISTAVLEDWGRDLVRELASLAPCTLEEWSSQSPSTAREELIEFTRDLAEMGMVAFL